MKGLAAFVAALALCTCAIAQGNAQGGGWAAVEGIAPGSRVEVQLLRAKTVKGMLAGVSASGIEVLASNGSTRRLDRAKVKKVYLVGKAHKLRGGFIGAGIGAAAGVVVGLVIARNGYWNDDVAPAVHESDRTAAASVLGLLGAAVVAVIGTVIGSHHSKTLVYKRDHSASAPSPALAALHG